MFYDVILLIFTFLLLIAFSLSFFKKIHFIENQSDSTLKIARAILILLAGTLIHFGCVRTGRPLADLYGFFDSFYSSAKLFLVDGSLAFKDIRNSMPNALKYIYFSLYYLVCFIAVSISAYTVLSFFESFSQNLKLLQYAKKRNICIFNELNTKTMFAAKSLLCEEQPESPNHESSFDFFSIHPNTKKAPLIIFCDVFNQNEETSYELASKAKSMGAICFKKSAVEIHKKLRKLKAYQGSEKRLLRYYLFGQNEKENVHHAIDIVKEETSEQINATNRFENLGIFVLAFGNSNGIMLESLNKLSKNTNEKNSYFVRRLDPALMMAQHIIFDKENYLVDKQTRDKDLNVLVVGMGQYGFEIIKILAWFYQRKEGNINIHIVDRNPSAKSFAAAHYPELVNYNPSEDKTEDSQFKLIFHDPCEVFSLEFNELLNSKQLNSLDAVFISLGDDTLNAEAAIHIRTLLDRIHYKDVYSAEEIYGSDCEKETPYILFDSDQQIKDKIKIFAVIHNDENNLSFDGENRFSGGIYNISFVGMDSKLYSCENIYNFAVENEAAESHYHNSNNPAKTPANSINHYNSVETDRISSIALTQHKKFITYLYPEENYPTLAKIENKRWNAFTRSRGFVLIDKKITKDQREDLFVSHHDSVKRRFLRGKWHNSLVPFQYKGTSEQNNNNFNNNNNK